MAGTTQDTHFTDSVAKSVGQMIMAQNTPTHPPFGPIAPMFPSQPVPYVNPSFAQQYNPHVQQFPPNFYGQPFGGPQGFNNNGKQFSFNNGRKKDVKCFICNGPHVASDCKQHQELKDKVTLLEKQAEAAASIAQNGPQNYQLQQVGQQQATIFSGVGSAGSAMNVPTPQGQLQPPAPPTMPTINKRVSGFPLAGGPP